MEKLSFKAQKCLETAKKRGIDKALCSVTSSVVHEFNVDGGEFSLFRTLFNQSLSLTVYNKGKKGSVTLNKSDDEAIASAVENCIALSESALPDEAWDIAPDAGKVDFTEGQYELDTDKLFSRTEELMSDIKARHPLIMMEQMIVKHTSYDSCYANTNGSEFNTKGGQYSLDLMFSAHEGDATSSFYGSGVICDNLDKPFIELGTVEKDLSDVEKQIYTVPVEGKFTGTVIFPPQSLGSVLGSALSNFAGDMGILDGTSIWKDSLGKQVADERITIGINPLDERIICGERYTGEGFISENYDVIKNGVLDSYMLSLYVANKTGKERAKNSSFSVVMENGDTSVDDIIKGVEKGIIVGRMSGGSPANNGDFSAVAKNSFYVENGVIKNAVSETMINGNLADMLRNVRAISKETICDGTSVLPYVAFDNMTVSGK